MGLGVFFNGRKINASLTKERDETYFKNKKINDYFIKFIRCPKCI